MTKTDPHSNQSIVLRQRAEEEITAQEAGESEVLSPEEKQHALHELRVHQIELEMQYTTVRCMDPTRPAGPSGFAPVRHGPSLGTG